LSYLGEVLADGPAVYYRFGETAGVVVADASGNGRDGTWSGSPALGQVGALATDPDPCALFDGVDDKVTVPAPPAIGTTFSVELWLRHQGGADARQALLIDAGGTLGLMFGSDARLNLRYSGADHKNGTALSANIWHHVLVSVAAGAGTFYVDGVADGAAAAVPSGFAPDRIGDDTGSDTFKGYLDELALYVVALSAARVLAHLAAAFRGLLGLRGRLRRELHDEDSAAYRWTDAEMERHLLRAADELSEVWPQEAVTVLVATPGSREVSIASLAELVRIERVEWPVGAFPREYVQFSTWGATLTLETEDKPASADAVNVYWGRRHQVERLSSTLPAETEDTVVLGASGFALLELAEYAANRANTGGPTAVREYERQGRDRLDMFRQQLRRFGRAGRVRTSTLYAPARAAPQSQTTDPGPS